MTKRNMKIEINESQPLDDVVRELERLGFNECGYIGKGELIVCLGQLYTWCTTSVVDELYFDLELATLAELKEMK